MYSFIHSFIYKVSRSGGATPRFKVIHEILGLEARVLHAIIGWGSWVFPLGEGGVYFVAQEREMSICEQKCEL